MSTDDARDQQQPARTRSCATALVCRACGARFALEQSIAFCPDCNRCLDIDFDYALATRRLAELPVAERPHNIWRFEELLPITDAPAQARVGEFSGYTPLIRSRGLAAELGLSKLYLKDDSTSRPSLSYKDRVVAMAIARVLELGEEEIGCVSTGNVGTAVAAFAARAGISPYVFYPDRLEPMKARVCRALGALVCQVAGNYDEVNRECRRLAQDTGLEFANITLRPFYAEGGKTMAFELVEQLHWRAPDHIVTAAAGGTLSSRVHKGLIELQTVGMAQTDHTRIHIAQPEGCDPIASAILAHDSDIHACRPTTAAHSLAIGAPGDGHLVIDAVRSRGGTAAAVSDGEIFECIDLLAATEGILTEPAGGTTIAVLRKLVADGTLDPDEVVVAVITGNGLKTLDEHPAKPWPSMIECDSEAMHAALEDLKHAGAGAPSA
ncbi:MAG: threonine synthase [Solirubrobacterales bacterium]|nr:threonine synthase [Solirubrobacterales bacterium]